MKTVQTHNGMTIYQGMGYPESLEGLDLQIVKNTLSYYEFIADMSDDFYKRQDELDRLNQYKAEHNLGGN